MYYKILCYAYGRSQFLTHFGTVLISFSLALVYVGKDGQCTFLYTLDLVSEELRERKMPYR
jgi:hypothetical protein